MGVCNCSMFCCTLLSYHSCIAFILMGKRELVALLNLSSWCLVMVEKLFLAVPRGCLRFVIMVFPDHTHLLFLAFQAPFGQFITGAKLLLGTPKYEKNNPKRYTCLYFVKNAWLPWQRVMRIIRMVVCLQNQLYLAFC